MPLIHRSDRCIQTRRDSNVHGRTLIVLLAATALFVAIVALGAGDATAAARHPFAIAGNESGSGPCGMFGWLFAPEVYFKKQVDTAMRAATHDGSAVWLLVGLSALYGILHAAGPGHGKAVVAAYMVANERALRRGLVISCLAALLQGAVAVAIVATAVFVLGIPLIRTRTTTEIIEIASFAGVALLGAWLTWSKGRTFVRAIREARARPSSGALAHASHHQHTPRASVGAAAVDNRMVADASSRLGSDPAQDPHVHADHLHDDHVHDDHVHDDHVHDDHVHGEHVHDEHVHDEHCGHFHAPDPRRLGEGFSWGSAALTVGVAGARPCTGAFVVLAFALQQGIFFTGVLAVFAMSVGTALTTGALATMAVVSKGMALRLFGRETTRGVVMARGFELAAAVLVLLVGVSLLLGSWGMAACG